MWPPSGWGEQEYKMATSLWSLCNKIIFINPNLFLINLMDPTNARNVERIKWEDLFDTPLLTELPNGSFQDRHCKRAYDSSLIATSFIFINSF